MRWLTHFEMTAQTIHKQLEINHKKLLPELIICGVLSLSLLDIFANFN